MSATNISYKPTVGLSYDPDDATYWDPAALDGELTRVFEVCHGCRMCFKYCDSFPLLFKFVDGHDGDVRKVTVDQTKQVIDACFQCKLCEVQCPYTPRDGHEFQLDFPKLVHRYKAQDARRNGIALPDRVLGAVDATGKFARLSFGLANTMNRVAAHRFLMEKLLGVDRRKLLPDFAGESFEAWAGAHGKLAGDGAAPEAVLFQTCFVEHNQPEIGRDALAVLEKNAVRVGCVAGFVCCGMPKWEHGDLDGLRVQARRNLALLLPYVERGAKVLVINPTCSMMLRREYPELVETELRDAAKKVAEATRDVSEYLFEIRDEPRFSTAFESTPGPRVAYHAPCHLRAQGKGMKGRDLLRKIPGVTPQSVTECCGHDGTYAMRTHGFEPSIRIGKKAFLGMAEADAEVWATDCPLAALQFAQHAGKRPMHPLTVLARAYEADGFPTPLPKTPVPGPSTPATKSVAATPSPDAGDPASTASRPAPAPIPPSGSRPEDEP